MSCQEGALAGGAVRGKEDRGISEGMGEASFSNMSWMVRVFEALIFLESLLILSTSHFQTSFRGEYARRVSAAQNLCDA